MTGVVAFDIALSGGALSGVDWAALAPIVVAMLGAGLAAGFAAGLFGIGGGFVVVPAMYAVLNLLDSGAVESRTHIAVGTSLGAMILTAVSSTRAHARRGAVDFRLVRTWAPWIVIGVIAGSALAARIDGRLLTLIFAVGVFILAAQMMIGRQDRWRLGDEMPGEPLRAAFASFLGFFSALLGIGGATYVVLVMTLHGRPIHQAIGTAASFGAVIAIPGAIAFAIIGVHAAQLPPGSLGYVNMIGVVAISAMTILTAPLGAALAHRLNAKRLRRVFALYLFFTSALLFKDGLAM